MAQLWTHAAYFIFESEHEQLLSAAGQMGSRFNLHSSPIGPTGLNHGPLFYLLVWPLVWFFPDPLVLRIAWVFVASLGAVIFGDTLRRVSGGIPALVAVAGLTTSWFWFESGRQLWHSSLLPLPMAIFFACQLRYFEERREALLTGAGIAAAICVQLHAQTAYLGLIFIASLIGRSVREGVRHAIAPAVGAALTLAPLLASILDLVTSGRLASGQRSGSQLDVMADVATWLSSVIQMASPAGSGSRSSLIGILWLALATVGLATEVARTLFRKSRYVYPAVLSACFALGGLSTVFLLGWQNASRYLHTLALPTFALAAIAVGVYLEVIGRRSPSVAVLLARVLVVGAVGGAGVMAFWPVGAGVSLPFLNASSQHQLATAIDRFTADAGRVHGYYASDKSLLIGVHYFHDLRAPLPTSPLAEDEALVVIPQGTQIRVSGASEVINLETWPVRLSVYRVRPRAILETVKGRSPESVFARDAASTSALGSASDFEVHGRIATAGEFVLQIRRSDGGLGCRYSVLVDGKAPNSVSLSSPGPFEHYALNAPEPGVLVVRFSGCPEEIQLDAF